MLCWYSVGCTFICAHVVFVQFWFSRNDNSIHVGLFHQYSMIVVVKCGLTYILFEMLTGTTLLKKIK